MPIIEYHLPYCFEPRNYQKPLLNAFLIDKKRFGVIVWHRRAGKDKTCINIIALKMLERVGLYVYLFPELKQAKRIIWNGRDKNGFRFIDHFPQPMIKSINHTEMRIELINGSVFQLLGSDNYNSLMGFNPVGVIFSEYSLTNPLAWDFVRPIIMENGGWCLFQGTPRGENHFFDLYQNALHNEEWFCEILTIDNTKAINAEEIERSRRDGMPEELIQQEFYCSFTSSNVGSFYGAILEGMERNKHIIPLKLDKTLPVHTAWDIGYGDATAIWFFQYSKDDKFYLVHYYEDTQVGLNHYTNYVSRWCVQHQVRNGINIGPHDIKVHEWGTGKTRFELALQFGLRFRVCPNVGLISGIESVISMLDNFYIDPVECKTGLNSLRSYTRKWDNEKKIFRKEPEHNFASHGADSMRMLCVGWRDYMGQEKVSFQRKLNGYHF